jgi:hypothetical protein
MVMYRISWPIGNSMVIICSHSKDNLYQESFNEQLSIARKRLEEFPILNDIFKNFDGYRDRHYEKRKNKVFITCCPRPNGRNDAGYPQLLAALEDSLKIFKIKSRERSSYNEIIRRFTSYDYYESEGAVLEIMAAYEIGKIIGFEKLCLHPKLRNGKNGDALVTIKGRPVFIEVTSLRERKPEMKIRHAFCELAKYLSAKCIPKNYAITIHVDSARLPKEEQGHIIAEMSVRILKYWSDILYLRELAGLTCLIDFRDDYSWIEDRKYLSELVGTKDECWLQPELAEMIKTQPQAAEWASKIEIKSINLSPISTVICNAHCRGDLVEVQSEEVYPSAAAFAQESGFHRQLAGKIKNKIEARQYDEGSPVIIMIKEDTWDKAFFDEDPEGIDRIEAIIKEELQKSNQVSGVLIYGTPTDARYIENNNTDQRIRITHDELVSMGISSLNAK